MKTLYKVLQVFTLFTALSASAAPTPEKHPVDNFQIGVGTSSSQKQFIFDLGLGATNPNLGVDTTLQGLNYNKNNLQWGDGLTSQKNFTANIGNGATNPKIIWDNANGTWAFSNDGTNFSSFGSGSGGASGIQLLTNGDFESGITLGWGNTGGTFAVATSGPNLLVGKKSATFTASAGGQSVQSSLYTIPNGLTGQSCAASMMYKGGDIGLTFEVVDNSSNILASQVIQAAPNATVISLPFQCPSSGSIRVKILSGASSALIAFDQMFLGQNTLIALSQASYFGGVQLGADCALSNTSGTFADLAESGSSCSTYALKGNATAWDHTNGQVTFANMPPGEYVVTYNGMCWSPNAVPPIGQLNIIDDASSTPVIIRMDGLQNTSSSETPCIMTSHFSYTTAATHTFKLHGLTGYPGVQPFGWVSNSGETVTVFRYPTQSEQAVRPETINWIASGYLASPTGNDFALDTSATYSFQEIVGVDVALNVDPGSTGGGLQIPCSGSNPSTGLTCSGTPDAGIVFNQPAAGDDEVCFYATAYKALAGVGASIESFKLVETPNNSQTILQSGTNIRATESTAASSIAYTERTPFTLCEIFHFNSAGQKTIRIFNNRTSSGAISNDALMADEDTNADHLKFIIRPVTQNVPAPILVGQPVAFRVEGVPTGSPSGSIVASVWNPIGTNGYDTNNGYNVSTGEYTIPVSGLWFFDCSTAIEQNAGTNYQFDIYLNATGVQYSFGQMWYDGANPAPITRIPKTSAQIYLNAGQKIVCQTSLNIAGTYTGDASTSYFEGHLLRN